jgi:hypothetical protein
MQHFLLFSSIFNQFYKFHPALFPLRKSAAIAAISLFAVNSSPAQTPYTDPIYDYRVETDVVYGEAVDFAGVAQTLYMDIYKPVCDFNPSRPLFVFAHGGAFLAGDKNAGDIVALCRALARRGAVAVSISYRLGMHVKGGNFDPGFFCIQNKCIYVLDSTEVIRAAYRGVQDMKGAVRFLKSRHAVDSTDIDNVFVGGSSAGGFLALYTGFLDQPSEKPAPCFELPDAPLPSPLIPGNCAPPNASRARPDLGDIEGTLHLAAGNDASVRGVANFMGGMMGDILSGPRRPALYMYHQTDDLIVGCNYRRPFSLLFQYCGVAALGCNPLYDTFPLVHGSCRLADMAAAMGDDAPPLLTDIIDNGSPANLSCLSGNNHSIVGIEQRVNNMMAFFGPMIAESGNNPMIDLTVTQEGNSLTVVQTAAAYQWIDCATGEPIPGATGQSFTMTEEGDYAVIVGEGDCTVTSDCLSAVDTDSPDGRKLRAALFPNPNNGRFALYLPWAAEASLYDATGRLLQSSRYAAGRHEMQIDVPAGMYLLVLRYGEGVEVIRVARGGGEGR